MIILHYYIIYILFYITSAVAIGLEKVSFHSNPKKYRHRKNKMQNSESYNYLQKVFNLRPSLLASDQVYFSQHPGFIPCLKTR